MISDTAASYLAMSGATTAEIAAVLGHRLEMVKRYAHLSDQHSGTVVERMTRGGTTSAAGDSGAIDSRGWGGGLPLGRLIP